MARTFDAAEGIRAIDTRMCGRDQVTSAYLVEADEPALVETGPTTSLDTVREGLTQLGVGAGDLAHIVVTHIHLDHAGGAGALAPHYPRAQVWVHERGARHLTDPTRLVESAGRIYGDARLRELFGPVKPVPADRVRAVDDGQSIPLGNRALEVLYTPGHAGHHVCLVDSGTGGVFVGDAYGVFLPDVQVLRPATPPPEFDLELAVASIDRVAQRDPSTLLFSHFGPATDVAELSLLAIERLREWTAVVQAILRETNALPEVTSRLRAAVASEEAAANHSQQESLEDRYELLSSYEMNAMGLMRYLDKRAADRP